MHLCILSVKDLGDLNAGEIFGKISVDICGAILYLSVSASGKFAENYRK